MLTRLPLRLLDGLRFGQGLVMAEDKQGEDQLSDVKASFAWGQLFAGSLIGGLAVWKLLHKLTNTEPSEWFLGLSGAYEEVRNFVMIPFSWVILDLTTSEKNVLLACTIGVGAYIRVLFGSTSRDEKIVIGGIGVIAIAILTFWLVLAFSGAVDLERVSRAPSADSGVRVLIIWLALAVLLLSLFLLLLALRKANEERFRWARHNLSLIPLNVLFTFVCGTAFLLLNWATS